MEIRPIRTDEDYDAAVKEIDQLWGAPEGSPEGDRLDVLATLVDVYRSERWPFGDIDPVDILHAMMDEQGRTQGELAALLGSRSRAFEILNRKRHLTLDQIRTISVAWHILAGALIKPYELSREPA